MSKPKNLVAESTTTVSARARDVWHALVTPQAIKEYMFGTDVRSSWRVGDPITWKGEWQGKPYEDKGVIRTMDPGSTLAYTHFSPMTGKPDVPENYHTVTIALEPEGDGTRVTLTQDNNADEKERAHSQKNWDGMLAGLKKYVEARSRAKETA